MEVRTMRGDARGTRVQVFLGETDQVGHVPRYTALLEYLRKEGAAGATVTRGIAGFGVNSKIRTSTILSLSMDLPVVVTWIDSPERVERLLPGVRERAGSGIIALDDVRIASYGGRGVEQLRFDLAVRDVMRTDVVSVADTAPVREAVELLIGRDFRALPVVDALGILRGIIANTDLIEKAGLKVRLELLEAMPVDSREAALSGLPALRVFDVMHREPHVLKLDDTVATATKRMSELRLKRMPVVDQEGRLVGILSRADVLRAVAEAFPREAPGDASRAGALTAGELMRSDAPVVQDNAPLSEVVNVVASTRLNRAIVVDAQHRVLGVITDADVLRSVEPAARPGVVGALMRVGGSAASKSTAADVMHADAPVVDAGATLAAAAQLMVTHRRKILPVVDGERRLLGVIDRADLLHAASGALDELGAVAAEDDEE
jgi:CBS-domain-containing membrane protein/PII-like signaling protein